MTRRRKYLQGSKIQGWFAPDITGDKARGIGNWSVEQVAAYLKAGHNQVSAATGPMGEAVSLSTSHRKESDLNAIAVYLKVGSRQAGRGKAVAGG